MYRVNFFFRAPQNILLLQQIIANHLDWRNSFFYQFLIIMTLTAHGNQLIIFRFFRFLNLFISSSDWLVLDYNGDFEWCPPLPSLDFKTYQESHSWYRRKSVCSGEYFDSIINSKNEGYFQCNSFDQTFYWYLVIESFGTT